MGVKKKIETKDPGAQRGCPITYDRQHYNRKHCVHPRKSDTCLEMQGTGRQRSASLRQSGSGVRPQAAAKGFLSTVIPRWRRMGDREWPAVKSPARRGHVLLGVRGRGGGYDLVTLGGWGSRDHSPFWVGNNRRSDVWRLSVPVLSNWLD